jgi:hypothetical protein
MACFALFALVGCSTSTGEVKLGVDVAALKSAAGTQTAGGTQPSTDAPLDITRVRLLVGHAKIGYAGGHGLFDTSDETDTGPYVVDLTADEIANGAHREFSLGELPSGTYGGAEIEIKPIDPDQDASADEFADFRTSGASVLVDGTYQGKSFSFAGHFLAEQGTDGEVTVDASKPVALAMAVDPSKWFLDGSGAALDPGDATQHDTLAVAICKTLDTQPQLDAAAPGPGGRGGHGGGGEVHCVEAAP